MSGGCLPGPGMLAEDARLGLLVLPWRQRPDFLEAQMLAHFVAKVLGLGVPARPRGKPNVRRERCHERPKHAEGSKAAAAFQQFRGAMHAEQTDCLSGPVYRYECSECPNADQGATRRKPIA